VVVRRAALIAALALSACDADAAEDAGVTSTDAGADAGAGVDAGSDAGVDAGASCDDLMPAATDLVMSEIQPLEHIELFNPTDADVDLAAADYWLCSPFIYVPLDEGVVPARGYLSVDWPFDIGVSAAVEDRGELILYSSGADFDAPDLIIDFACWGTRPAMSRKTQAEVGGHWTGDCAAAIEADGSIHRVAGSDGTSGASYDTAAPPSPMSCAPR